MTDIALPYFFSHPDTEPPWPGVVVLQEANGISTQLLRFCQKLAGAGFATLAPDLYFRQGGTESSDYLTLAQTVDEGEVRSDLTAAVDVLRGLGAEKVGITGFCMGGTFSYRAALWDIGVECAASFYGSGISEMLGTPSCPVLLFFGGADLYITADAVEAVRAHHGDDVIVYAEAGHGFMRDLSDDYHEEAVDDAWPRLLDFFNTNLAPANG